MLRAAIVVATCLAGSCVGTAFAESAPPSRLPTAFVAPDDPAVLRKIAAGFEVLRQVDGGYEVAVPPGRAAELHRLDPEARQMRPDLHAGLAPLPETAVEDRLKALAHRYAGEAQLDVYGTSAEGRPEWVLTTALGADRPDPAKPELLVLAGIHGDEVLATDVLLGELETLLKAHGTDPRLTRLLDGAVIHWVPSVCVDAAARGARDDGGVDPERDFPTPEAPQHVPASRCVRDLIAYVNRLPQLRGALELRAGARLIAFPWSYTTVPVPAVDHQAVAALAARMARGAGGIGSGQLAAQVGATPGSGVDYFNRQRHATALAYWVHPSLAPLPAAISDALFDASEPTWRFLEQLGSASPK